MKLVKGQGSASTGACWMSALHYYTRNDQTWTDMAPLACVSPVVRRLCIHFSDQLASNEERGRIIGQHLFLPLGTNTGAADEIARGLLCADYAVRKFAPIWLEIVGMKAMADSLRAVLPIVDKATAKTAYQIAHSSADAAYAASAAFSASSADAAYAADAALKKAGRRDELIGLRLQLILDCCAIGERKEVVNVCSKDAVLAVCQ